LGLIEDRLLLHPEKETENVINALKNYCKTNRQQFHNYSAITVEGRATDNGPIIRESLWWWSKNNLIHRITPPTKDITIYSMDIGEPSVLNLSDFKQESLDRLSKIRVDPTKFRVHEIIHKLKCFEVPDGAILVRIPIIVTVSTGTYVRQIVRDIRENLGIPLLCNKICRTSIF